MRIPRLRLIAGSAVVALGALSLLGVATPAFAQRHDDHHFHRDYHRDYGRHDHPYYGGYQPYGYYAPPPGVYGPPPPSVGVGIALPGVGVGVNIR
jgi:hypothetical protein